MTTGRITTSRIALPIHHHTMASSSARVLVRDEETPEYPGQRHPGGAQAECEAARGPGGRGGGELLGRLAPLEPGDPVLHVRGEVLHEDRGDVGDHAPAVLSGCARELEVLGHLDLRAPARRG